MIYLPVSQLEPTMVVAATVPHPNRACNDLLRPGYQLSEKTIERLAELNVPGVWVQYPPLEQLGARLIDRIPSINQKLYLTFRDSFDRTAKPTTFNFDFQTYRQTIIELVLAMFEEGRHSTLLGRLFDSGEPFVDHCLNVCFVSLVLGINAQHYLIQERAALPAHLAADTTNLGLGAIFHDIGKIANDTQDLLRHNILYVDPDDDEYKQHVAAGYELMRGKLPPSAAHVILNHHRRYDGSGFPTESDSKKQGIDIWSGHKIHVFARITAIADVFDNLLRSGEKRLPTVFAISQLQSGRFRGWFDPVLVQKFMETIPPFAPGQLVQLNTRQFAVILSVSDSAPCRPTVRLFRNADGTTLPPEKQTTIDLSANRDYFIAAVDGVDVSEALYEPATPQPNSSPQQ